MVHCFWAHSQEHRGGNCVVLCSVRCVQKDKRENTRECEGRVRGAVEEVEVCAREPRCVLQGRGVQEEGAVTCRGAVRCRNVTRGSRERSGGGVTLTTEEASPSRQSCFFKLNCEKRSCCDNEIHKRDEEGGGEDTAVLRCSWSYRVVFDAGHDLACGRMHETRGSTGWWGRVVVTQSSEGGCACVVGVGFGGVQESAVRGAAALTK